MTPSEQSPRDPAPEAEWEVWYQDTFDRERPPSVDVSGRGLARGLMELYARSTTQRRDRTCNTLRGHELARRRDLFPAEPDHPRADEPYYKLQMGPLIELELPINSLRWRRITFIVICPWH